MSFKSSLWWYPVFGLVAACGSDEVTLGVIDIHPDAVTECEFRPIKGFDGYSEYGCNPVFTTSNEKWAGAVGTTEFTEVSVFGHTFYQIWYVGENQATGEVAIGTAMSADGTNWQPHDDNPGLVTFGENAWDGGLFQQQRVAWDEEQQLYRMLYGGISSDFVYYGIGSAVSIDGVHWQSNPGNPVLDLNIRYNNLTLEWPVQYEISEGVHNALFAARPNSEDFKNNLYLLQTTDPFAWASADVTPVLLSGEEGAWDSMGFLSASSAVVGDTSYLFYVGYDTIVSGDDGRSVKTSNMNIGLATAKNGEPWKRVGADGRIALHQGEGGKVTSVAARAIGDRVHLWVTDYYPDLGGSAVGYYIFEPELAQ